MSSRVPANVNFSLDEFARHGGLTGPHRDGWGIVYYDDGDVQLVKEAQAAAESDWVHFIKEHRLRSDLVISHIRNGATGAVRAFKNTQPFVRELGGRMHVFAHNGRLSGVEPHPDLTLDTYRPIGETDSEYAFCALLEKIRGLWLGDEAPPSIDARLRVVSEFAAAIRDLGPANFLYSDGLAIFAHGDRRTQADGEMRPPGLFFLCRSCAGEEGDIETDGLAIKSGNERQEVALVASVPLTDEPWTPLREGEVVGLSFGKVAHRSEPCPSS